MHPVITKTLGGLSLRYYFRQLLLGAILCSLFIPILVSTGEQWIGLFAIASTLIYPYSRFVYEELIEFIPGKNVMVVNLTFMLAVKFFNMSMCWMCAIFIAPVGLLYLYVSNRRVSESNLSEGG